MGKLHTTIDGPLQAFIEKQHVFFVATAPLAADGHVNLSPKGLDTFRVLTPTSVAYLDYVGSGAETIAHIRENGRMVIMFCAFDGPPKILRLHGRGEVLDPSNPEFELLRPLFPNHPVARAIIVISVDRIADSCGFGVPLYEYRQERSQLTEWSERKGVSGLTDYQNAKNVRSLDGLPAVTWVTGNR